MADVDDGPCGVCISGGDGDEPEFCSETIVRARKAHSCCECRETIPHGAEYERTVGKWDGAVNTYKTCLACSEIRRTLCCDGWTYGRLFEQAEESAASSN